MGATNHTPNYNLPQFIGTDKPTWLSDVNGAFSDIDTQMKANATAAAQGISDAAAADSVATSANNKANTLDTQINTPSTGIAAVVSDHTTDITGIQSTIGSTPLPTTAQTLTGAIAEIYGTSVSYTHTTGTYGQMLNGLAALVDFTKITANTKLVTTNSAGNKQIFHLDTSNATLAEFTRGRGSASNYAVTTYNVSPGASGAYSVVIDTGSTTVTDTTSSTITDMVIELFY